MCRSRGNGTREVEKSASYSASSFFPCPLFSRFHSSDKGEEYLIASDTLHLCALGSRFGRHDISRACLSSPAGVSRLSDIRIDTFRARWVSTISRDACTHKHRISRPYIKGRANSETMPIDIRYSAGVVLSSDNCSCGARVHSRTPPSRSCFSTFSRRTVRGYH